MNPEEKPFAYVVLSERGSHVATFLTEKEKEQFLETSLFRENDKIIELFQKPISPEKCGTELVYDDSKIYYNLSVRSSFPNPYMVQNVEVNFCNEIHDDDSNFDYLTIRMILEILFSTGGGKDCLIQNEILNRLVNFAKGISNRPMYGNDFDFVFVIGFYDEILDNQLAEKMKEANVNFVMLRTFLSLEFYQNGLRFKP
jgi:hypothetical protein